MKYSCPERSQELLIVSIGKQNEKERNCFMRQKKNTKMPTTVVRIIKRQQGHASQTKDDAFNFPLKVTRRYQTDKGPIPPVLNRLGLYKPR